MTDDTPLDNPIWHALDSAQRSFNRGAGLAARYDPDISRFVALARPTSDAFDDLARFVEPLETVALFTAASLDVPSGWDVVRSRPMDQMVCDRLDKDVPPLELQLDSRDVPQMLALAQTTEPGPFSEGTIKMGRYFGFKSDDGQLVAMAGERLRMTGYTEISAVCTHPAYRGRGYARDLVNGLTRLAFLEGCIPFLHVKTENGAKAVYQSLGFRVRREMQLTVLKRQS